MRHRPRADLIRTAFSQVRACFKFGGGCGIRTREGLHPTRFPSLPAAGQSMFTPHREATITGMATDHELR